MRFDGDESGSGSFETASLTRQQVLRRGLAAAAALSVGSAGMGVSRAFAEATSFGSTAIRRGGTLRASTSGGGPTETLDPMTAGSNMDIARAQNLYEKLADFQGPTGKLKLVLAETIETYQGKADDWIIRVKPDIEWHNGKTLTADDVIYSFARVLNPQNQLGGRDFLSFIDPNGLSKVDPRTVRMKFTTPIADPAPYFATRYIPIIQNGFTDFNNPIGTGPFQFTSWVRGERTVFSTFKNYHVEGLPYVDTLELISIADPTARLSALESGQLDMITDVDPAQGKRLSGSVKQLLSTQAGFTYALVMPVNQRPFTDKRVRQAFKYLIDRKQILSNALLGEGRLANDLVSPIDPLFAKDLKPYPYDPEKAKSLLKAAGHSGLKIDLNTGAYGAASIAVAEAFAQQAKAGGVKVNVKVTPADSYWTTAYLKTPFFMTGWGYFPLDAMIALAFYSGGSSNETSWKKSAFDKEWRVARATIHGGRRRQLYHNLQEQLYDDGGYIIPAYNAFVDAARSNVHGFVGNPTRPLGLFNFKSVWLG